MMYLIIKAQISEIINRHNDCSALPPPSSFPLYPLNSMKLKLLVFTLVYTPIIPGHAYTHYNCWLTRHLDILHRVVPYRVFG